MTQAERFGRPRASRGVAPKINAAEHERHSCTGVTRMWRLQVAAITCPDDVELKTRGITAMNRAPPSGDSSRATRPPARSSISRTSASPRPLPFGVIEARSPRANTRSRSVVAIPGPSSSTVILTKRRSVTSIPRNPPPPGRPCLTALSIRLNQDERQSIGIECNLDRRSIVDNDPDPASHRIRGAGVVRS